MAKKIKSLIAQIRAMERHWPRFSVSRGVFDKSLVWIGGLRGLEREFQICISYGRADKTDTGLCILPPEVRVLSPSLRPNWTATEEVPLPHVYFDEDDLPLSPLCLFDPEAGEWNPTMLIANTTVPWTARWLACYEIWEATGEWVGGGRHIEFSEQPNAA